MLSDYLEYTARFLIEEPWKFSVDIEKELAKTFDNLDQFKSPKGEIFLVIFDQNWQINSEDINQGESIITTPNWCQIETKFRLNLG